MGYDVFFEIQAVYTNEALLFSFSFLILLNEN